MEVSFDSFSEVDVQSPNEPLLGAPAEHVAFLSQPVPYPFGSQEQRVPDTGSDGLSSLSSSSSSSFSASVFDPTRLEQRRAQKRVASQPRRRRPADVPEYKTEASRRKYVRWSANLRCIHEKEHGTFQSHVERLMEDVAPGMSISPEAVMALMDASELFLEQWYRDGATIQSIEKKGVPAERCALRPRHLTTARMHLKLNKLGPDEHFFHPDFTNSDPKLVPRPPQNRCGCSTCEQRT